MRRNAVSKHGWTFFIATVLAVSQAATTLADGKPPIPLPPSAADVEFDGSAGSLEFNSTAAVKDIAQFYRSAMKPLGWKEEPTVINKDNMAVLYFDKGEQTIVLTIMKMGANVNVSATGSGLEVEAAAGGGDGAGTTAPKAAEGTADAGPLEAEDAGGFPVPKQHSSSGTEQTPFRKGIVASVPASVATVTAFYRQELAKLPWKELADRAVADGEHADLQFTTPDGPGLLTLRRENGETSVRLTIRMEAAAKASGQLPKPGYCKVLLGNILDKEASITLNNQTVKVGAHAGEKGPGGPTLELKPGTYKYTLKGAGGAGAGEAVKLGPDEIWGLMIGPGGVLALQMY